jgi:predicted RND superfamily exporter protein
MATWPVDLNMYNLVVLPSLLGLGIDNSVHLTHRWVELGPGRMRDVIRGVMGPIAVSTLTTMIGFGGMMAAHQSGLRSLGVLAVLGMGFSMVAVFTLLPALLLCLDTRKSREAAARVSAAAQTQTQTETETSSSPVR